MYTAFLLLGSNLGDRTQHLNHALKWLSSLGQVISASATYETEPWGKTDQATFLNRAIALKTGLEPEALLTKLKGIEREIGRTATVTWGPREIDIDILAMEGLIHQSPNLTIPHPRLAERRFALKPLAEIAPGLQIAGTGKTVAELLSACNDPLGVISVSR